MKLSVIIVNWNGRDYLDQCLESVYAQLEQLAPEVIVVDNASTDGSADMVSGKYPSATLVTNPENVGPVKANNQGIIKSTGEYVLLINTDAWPYDTSLVDLVRYLDDHPRAGAAGPQLVNTDGSLQPTVFPAVTLRHYFIRHWEFLLKFVMDPVVGTSAPEGVEHPYEVAALSTACVVLRRAMLKETRLFDEHFFIYCDDTDLFRRIAATQWRVVYFPAAGVIHAQGGSSTPAEVRSKLENFFVLKHAVESWHYYFYKHFGQGGLRRARIIDISAAVCRIALTALRMLDCMRLGYKRRRIAYDRQLIRYSLHSKAGRRA